MFFTTRPKSARLATIWPRPCLNRPKSSRLRSTSGQFRLNAANFGPIWPTIHIWPESVKSRPILTRLRQVRTEFSQHRGRERPMLEFGHIWYLRPTLARSRPNLARRAFDQCRVSQVRPGIRDPSPMCVTLRPDSAAAHQNVGRARCLQHPGRQDPSRALIEKHNACAFVLFLSAPALDGVVYQDHVKMISAQGYRCACTTEHLIAASRGTTVTSVRRCLHHGGGL